MTSASNPIMMDQKITFPTSQKKTLICTIKGRKQPGQNVKLIIPSLDQPLFQYEKVD